MQKDIKVALIHEYLLQHGGAERVLESLIELFPQAEIYTGLYNSKAMSRIITSQKVHSIQNPVLAKLQKLLTFLMPLYFESFDLRKYKLVISDGQAWPKGVNTSSKQLHIAYIHTPPRFLYGYSVESSVKRNKWYLKPILAVVDFGLRIWDYYAAQKPDVLLCNSKEVQSRIKRYYKRDATVIYPPVETTYTINEKLIESLPTDYFLAVSRLAAYKNIDLLINTFKQLPELKLKIIGTGAEETRLKMLAQDSPNIEFLGRADDETKHSYMQKCLGVINCVDDEDFGIVPIEAFAHGKPVLAHNSGGHKETVNATNGMLFDELNVECLKDAILSFKTNIERDLYNASEIKSFAAKYDTNQFKNNIRAFIEDTYKNFHE